MKPLPPSFAATRSGLHRLACYVISPARKAAEGRIGLRPSRDGFGTPVFGPAERRVAVMGDEIVVSEREAEVVRGLITTLTAAAWLVPVDLVADPGVGSDLPPFEPDAALSVDAESAAILGAWFQFGSGVLSTLGPSLSLGEEWIWPEHFDLGVTHEERVNIGFSPGDGFHDEPYVYVGPHDRSGLSGPYWNAPFGAYLGYSSLLDAEDPSAAAVEFIEEGVSLAGR